MYPNVHCNTIYNSQDMEETQMSTNREMEKEKVEYIYNEILLNHKKERKSAPPAHTHTGILLLRLLLSRFSRVDSVRPHRRQPIRLPRPWDSPGKNTGVGCHFLLQYYCYSTIKKNKNSAIYRDICTPMFVCGIIHNR